MFVVLHKTKENGKWKRCLVISKKKSGLSTMTSQNVLPFTSSIKAEMPKHLYERLQNMLLRSESGKEMRQQLNSDPELLAEVAELLKKYPEVVLPSPVSLRP